MMGSGDKRISCPECSARVQPDDKVCSNCGSVLEDVSRTLTSGYGPALAQEDWERFAPGNVFANRYTIIEEMGHGGMGRVYKAIDRSLGITVAIKIIRPEYASNPRIVDHFKKETVLSRSISSENVVRVYDLGEWESTKYISMDFVEGQTLRDLIRSSGSLTISTAVKFGQQICSGLAAAHKQGIIHRDLKPSNVMIDRTGRARVMDFGLAKTVDREDAEGVRALVGTPQYLSPEQARGEKLDQRTDIYALGLILYEMVTGHPVFESESLTGYINKHSEVNPEPPSRLNHLVPAALDSIILKCLRKDRNERFQTAEEVGRSLGLLVSPEVGPPKTLRSRVLRLSAWVAAGSALVLAVYFVFFRDRGPGITSVRKSVAVMSFENVTGDSAQDKWRDIRNLLLMDLEQSKFLRLVPREKLLQHLNDLRTGDTGVYAQDVLDRIASRENIDFFVLGSYVVSGEGCRIDVRVVNAQTREGVGSRSFNAAIFDEIQGRCDEISLWAKQHFGLSRKDLEKDVDQELKNYTTRSIDALICFVRGLDFYGKGDMKRSIEFYLQAVAIDKDFALAHARLAMNFTYEGRFEEAKKHILKAMSLRKNLLPRERLLIEGDYFNFYESDYPKAIERYETLLRIYPGDEMALEHKGAIYRNTEEWEKAAQDFYQLQAINPSNRITIENLAFISRAMGQYDRAAGILRDHAAAFDAADEFHKELAICLFCQGRINEAWLELQKALSLDPEGIASLRFAGHIQTVMGDYPRAEAAYRRLLEEGPGDLDKIDGHYRLGNLYLLQGRYESASREIEEGLELARSHRFPYEEASLLMFKAYFLRLRGDFTGAYDAASRARQKAVEVRYREDEVRALHLMGLCQVGLGNLAAAQETGLEMDQIIRKIGYPKLLRLGYHLEGTISAARNSWEEAVNHFSKAAESLPQQHFEYDQQAFYVESLAFALARGGDLDSARAQYGKVIALTTGILTAGDAYTRSLYELGRICQEKNETENAREYFQRFLKVLRDSDPGLAEVQDVRQRLASLS